MNLFEIFRLIFMVLAILKEMGWRPENPEAEETELKDAVVNIVSLVFGQKAADAVAKVKASRITELKDFA